MSYDYDFDYDSVLKILRSQGEINLDYFDERLRLQKLGYLAQELGANEGYPYSWYVRGPYSSTLTSCLFAGDDMGVFDDEVELNENENQIATLLGKLLGDKIHNPKTLELFASIWYLMPNRKLTNHDKENILKIIRKEKPHFNDNETKTTLNKIINFKELHNF